MNLSAAVLKTKRLLQLLSFIGVYLNIHYFTKERFLSTERGHVKTMKK